MVNKIVITYDGPADDEIFVRRMDRVFNKYPYDYNNLIEFETQFLDNFSMYITYGEIRFRNILFINSRGSGKIVMKEVDKPFYISSDADWILLFVFIFALVIMLLSVLDYLFYSKRKYDITYKMILV